MNSINTISQIAGLSAVIALSIAPTDNERARDSNALPLKSTAAQLVDGLDVAFGRHPDARAAPSRN